MAVRRRSGKIPPLMLLDASNAKHLLHRLGSIRDEDEDEVVEDVVENDSATRNRAAAADAYSSFSFGKDVWKPVSPCRIDVMLKKNECIVFRGSLRLIVRSGEVDTALGFVAKEGDDVALHSPKWTRALSVRGISAVSKIFLDSYVETDRLTFEVVKSSSSSEMRQSFAIPSDWQDAATAILADVDGERSNVRPPFILTCGAKSVGKSTFNRYLINRIVSTATNRRRNGRVLFVETDVGQSEMTSPGSISVHAVDTKGALLGPPHTHICPALTSHYFGSVSPDANPERYMLCLQRTFADMSAMLATGGDDSIVAVVINTCGWVRGLGLDLLGTVIAASRPTHVVQLQGASSTKQFALPCVSSPPFRLFPVRAWSDSFCQAPGETRRGMKASESRRLQLCTYFAPHRGTCGLRQKGETSSSLWMGMAEWMQRMVPIETSWKHVRFAILHEDVPLVSTLRAFNASLVGLCVSEPDSDTLDPIATAPHLRVVRDTSSVTKCVGLGVVRSVDVISGKLRLLTPVSLDTMRSVDTLVLGSLHAPNAFFGTKNGIAQQPYCTMTTDMTTTSHMPADDMKQISGTNAMRSRHGQKRRRMGK